jgi:ankyrin repeat protein
MAQDGDLEKARLLLDHGADINAVDEEYRSTPLGLAARWGHREMVALLLERGADPIKSGASWSTPLAWARKKGHAEIASMASQKLDFLATRVKPIRGPSLEQRWTSVPRAQWAFDGVGRPKRAPSIGTFTCSSRS